MRVELFSRLSSRRQKKSSLLRKTKVISEGQQNSSVQVPSSPRLHVRCLSVSFPKGESIGVARGEPSRSTNMPAMINLIPKRLTFLQFLFLVSSSPRLQTVKTFFCLLFWSSLSKLWFDPPPSFNPKLVSN